jgi:hypothetical protein
LNHVLDVPQSSKNLASIHKITSDNNVFFELHPDFFFIKDQESRKTLLQGRSKGGLYPLPCNTTSSSHVRQLLNVNKSHQSRWHACDSIGRNKHYVSFIDDFSKFTWIYLLKHKSEIFQKFQEFQNLVERLFDKKILAVQTDWGGGGEYQKLNTFFQQIGIFHHVSCPYAHQQNGSAERKHRHIVDVDLSSCTC